MDASTPTTNEAPSLDNDSVSSPPPHPISNTRLLCNGSCCVIGVVVVSEAASVEQLAAVTGGAGWNESTTSRKNLIRIGFIPTNGLDRESHQCEAKDENLCTSFGLALVLEEFALLVERGASFSVLVFVSSTLLRLLDDTEAKFRLRFLIPRPSCFDRLLR